MEALVKFSVRSINNLCFRGRNDFIRFYACKLEEQEASMNRTDYKWCDKMDC